MDSSAESSSSWNAMMSSEDDGVSGCGWGLRHSMREMVNKNVPIDRTTAPVIWFHVHFVCL